MRMVTAMEANRSSTKGCVMFAMNISSEKGKYVEDVQIFKRYHVLQQ